MHFFYELDWLKSCGKKLVLLGFFLEFPWSLPGCKGFTQQLTLYNGKDMNGSHYVFEKHMTAVPEGLGTFESFCYKGFWNVYDGPGFTRYNQTFSGGNETHVYCRREGFPHKSFRYGSLLNTNTEGAMSLYDDDWFEGNETIVDSAARASLQGKSIVFSGRGNWTVYEGTNFEGPSCLVYITGRNLDILIDAFLDVSVSLGLDHIGSVARSSLKDGHVQAGRECQALIKKGGASIFARNAS